MGFYGQVMYEFTKLFSKIGYTRKNNSLDPIDPALIADNTKQVLQADEMWEEIDFAPANAWIQINGSAPTDDIKNITIGHSIPLKADPAKTVISFEKIDEEPEEEYVELKNGDYFKIPSFQHDKAGHFVDQNNFYYKLPTAQLTIVTPDEDDESTDENITPNDSDVLQAKGDGQWISLVNSGNALKIAHVIQADTENKTDINSFECLSPYDNLTKDQFISAMTEEGKNSVEINTMTDKLNALPNDMTIIPLESGDLIQSQQISKDTNGHILTVSPVYYKLPVQPTTISFEQHDSRITDLETRLNNNSSSPSTITPIGETDPIEYGTYETDIVQRAYNVGNIGDMYANLDSNAKTVTKTIGSMDGTEDSVLSALQTLLGRSARQNYTISEAIQDLATKIGDQQSQINVLMKAVGVDSNT